MLLGCAARGGGSPPRSRLCLPRWLLCHRRCLTSSDTSLWLSGIASFSQLVFFLPPQMRSESTEGVFCNVTLQLV